MKKIIWPKFQHGSLDAEDSAGEYCRKLVELKESAAKGKPNATKDKGGALGQVGEIVTNAEIKGLGFNVGGFSESAAKLLAELLFDQRDAELHRNDYCKNDRVALQKDCVAIKDLLEACETDSDISELWKKKDEASLTPSQIIILKLLYTTVPTPKKAYPVAFYKQHLLTELCLIEQQINVVLGCLTATKFSNTPASLAAAHTHQDTLFFTGNASGAENQASRAKKILVDTQKEATKKIRETLKYPAKVCDAQIAGLTIVAGKKGEKYGNVILAHQNPSVRPFEPEDIEIAEKWSAYLSVYQKTKGAPLILSEGQWAALTEICAAIKNNHGRKDVETKLAAKVDIWMKQGGGKTFVVKEVLPKLFPNSTVLEFTIHSTDQEIKDLIDGTIKEIGKRSLIICLDESYFYTRFANVFLQKYATTLGLAGKNVENLTPAEKEKLRVHSIRTLRSMAAAATIVNFGASQSPSILQDKEVRGKLKVSDLKRQLAEVELEMGKKAEDPQSVAIQNLKDVLEELETLKARLDRAMQEKSGTIAPKLQTGRPSSASGHKYVSAVLAKNAQAIYASLDKIVKHRNSSEPRKAQNEIRTLATLLELSNPTTASIPDENIAALIVHMKHKELERINGVIQRSSFALEGAASSDIAVQAPGTPTTFRARQDPSTTLTSDVESAITSLTEKLRKAELNHPAENDTTRAAASAAKKLENAEMVASIRARQFLEFQKRAENNKAMYAKSAFNPIETNNTSLTERVIASLSGAPKALARTLPTPPNTAKTAFSREKSAVTEPVKEPAQRIQYIIPDLHLTEAEVTKESLAAIAKAGSLKFVAAPITFENGSHGGAIYNVGMTGVGTFTPYTTTESFRDALNGITLQKGNPSLLVIFDNTTYIGGDYEGASRKITDHVFDVAASSLPNLAMEDFMQAKRSRDPLRHQMDSIRYNVVVHGAAPTLSKESFFEELEANAKLRDNEALLALKTAKKDRREQVPKKLNPAILFILNQENEGRWDNCEDRDAMILQDFHAVGEKDGEKDKATSAFEGCNAYLAIEAKVISGEINLKEKILDAVWTKASTLDPDSNPYTKEDLAAKTTDELLELFKTISAALANEEEALGQMRQGNLKAGEKDAADAKLKQETEQALAAAKLSLEEAKGELQKSIALLSIIVQLIQDGNALNGELMTANIDPINKELEACVQSKVALEGALSEEGESAIKRLEVLEVLLDADNILTDSDDEAVAAAGDDPVEEPAAAITKLNRKGSIAKTQKDINAITVELSEINTRATEAFNALAAKIVEKRAAIEKKTAADAERQQEEAKALLAQQQAQAAALAAAADLAPKKAALQASYDKVFAENTTLAALAAKLGEGNLEDLEQETNDDAEEEAALQTAIQELIAEYDVKKTEIDQKLGAINTFLQDTPVGIDLIKAAIADIAKHTTTLEEITAQIDELSRKITGLIDERDQAAALLAQQQEEEDLVKNTQAFEARKLELTTLLQAATAQLDQSIAKRGEVPESFMVTIEGEPAQKVTLQERHDELEAVIAKITEQIEQITQEINLEKTPLAYQGALAKLTREDEEGSVTNSTTQLLQNTEDLLRQVTAAAEAKLAAAQDAALRLQQDTAAALQGLAAKKEALRANHKDVDAANLELSHLINNQKANLDLPADGLAEGDGEENPQQQLAAALKKYEAEKAQIAEDLAAMATFLAAENPAAIKEIQANIEAIETHTATLKKISDQVIDLNGKIIASIERKAEAERVAAEKLAQEQAVALLKKQQEEAREAEEQVNKAKANPPTLTESLTLATTMITPNKAPTEWDKEYGTDEAARQKTLAGYAAGNHPKAIGADAEKIGAENATLKAYGNACIKIKESKAPTPPFDDIISNLYTPEKMALIAMHITRSDNANATREKFEEFDFKNNKDLLKAKLIDALTDLTTEKKLDESIAWVADPEKIFRERDKKDLEEETKDIKYSADKKSKPKTFAMKTKAETLVESQVNSK